MKPTQCPLCHGQELCYGWITHTVPVVFRVRLCKQARMKAATCLACRAIVPYLEDKALAKIRAWSRRKDRGKKVALGRFPDLD